MALQDTMIVPKESEHFQFFETGSGAFKDLPSKFQCVPHASLYKPNLTTKLRKVMPVNATPWYRGDTFGLKQLFEAGKLVFETSPGDHLQIPEAQLLGLVDKYFKN